MTKIIHLTRFTCREIMSQRVFQIFALALFALPWLMLAPTSLFLLDLSKVMADLALMMLHIWLLMFIFFIAAPLLSHDIEHGICSMFLTLPMSRQQYFCGRFFGMVVSIIPLLLIYMFSTAGAMMLAASLWSGYFDQAVVGAVSAAMPLLTLPYISLIAALFFITARASGLPETTVFLSAVWVLCWSIPPVLAALHNSEVAAKTPQPIVMLLRAISQLLPDLTSSKIATMAAYHLEIHPIQLLAYGIEHLTYATITFYLATMLFAKRDLT